MLPELPVPGSSAQGPPNAAQALLYHSSLIQEASQYLSTPNDVLAAKLAEALSNTSTDDIQLTSKNVAAAGQPSALQQSSVLANVLARNNPAIFHSQSQWAAMNSHYQQQQPLNNGGYANSVPGGDYSNANSHFRGHNSQPPAAVQPEVKTETVATGNGQVFDQINHPNVKINLLNNVKVDIDNHMFKPSIKLAKLSQEDQDLLMKSGFKAFSKSNPEKAKEMGVTTNNSSGYVIPKLRRANSSTNYANSDGEGSGDESDDEESKKGGSRKFFRATEKEREEEKKKQKDEKRKRKADDFEYVSANDGKRRRHESPERSKSPEVFVPKKVTKKVERKLIPMIPKIDVEELMESNTFHRFNKTVELIFDNMEEVNMEELNNENPEEGAELPPEILIPKYQLQVLILISFTH